MPEPYYQDDHCTIYHGDCRMLIGDIDFDAVVTDPPYGINAELRLHGQSTGLVAEWDSRVPYELLGTLLGDGRPVVWFGAPQKMVEACSTFNPQPDRILVWAPRFTLSKSAKGGIAYRYHPIYSWNLPKQSPTVHDVITDMTEAGNWWVHQATKPLLVMTRLVSMIPSDCKVLDPFMGSGTTLRAAKDLGRKAIGIEIEERYCEIAAKRLGQEVLF